MKRVMVGQTSPKVFDSTEGLGEQARAHLCRASELIGCCGEAAQNYFYGMYLDRFLMGYIADDKADVARELFKKFYLEFQFPDEDPNCRIVKDAFQSEIEEGQTLEIAFNKGKLEWAIVSPRPPAPR